jgi:hypothetical protein
LKRNFINNIFKNIVGEIADWNGKIFEDFELVKNVLKFGLFMKVKRKILNDFIDEKKVD